MTFHSRKITVISTLTLSALLLSACNDNNPPSEKDEQSVSAPFITLSIDATAGGFGTPENDPANKFTYLDLDTGKVVELSDEQAESNTLWDVAYKRSSLKFNGGNSGSGLVTAAIAAKQSDFYDSNGAPIVARFSQATAETELDVFTSVTSSNELEFISDAISPAILDDGSESSWWAYDMQTHQMTARNGNWYLVRNGEGNSYLKFHVTAINVSDGTVDIEYFVQASGANQFTTEPKTVSLNFTQGEECFDADQNMVIDCSNNNWDLKLSVSEDRRRWQLWTNDTLVHSGQGAAFGPVTNPDDYYSGTRTTADYDFSGHYKTATTSNIFSEYPWYAYNLNNAHKLWPNYRVYVVDTTETTYKLQILNYYDDAGTSGVFKVRFESLGE